MRKLSFAIFLILFFCSAAFAAIKDSPAGFRGVKWGEPPSALGAREEKATGKNNILVSYTKNGDNMVIGTANIDTIEYVFVQDRLFLTAIITTKHTINCNDLRNAMEARYGEPEKTEDEEIVIWVDDKVSITYKYDRYENTATVHILSNKIFDQYEAAKKELDMREIPDFLIETKGIINLRNDSAIDQIELDVSGL